MGWTHRITPHNIWMLENGYLSICYMGEKGYFGALCVGTFQNRYNEVSYTRRNIFSVGIEFSNKTGVKQ